MFPFLIGKITSQLTTAYCEQNTYSHGMLLLMLKPLNTVSRDVIANILLPISIRNSEFLQWTSVLWLVTCALCICGGKVHERRAAALNI